MIREVVLWQVVFVHVLFSFWGCFSWGTPSECAFRSMERWLSGLRHTPGKRAYALTGIEGSNPSLSAMSLNLIPLPFCSHASGAFGRSLSHSSEFQKKGRRVEILFKISHG